MLLRTEQGGFNSARFNFYLEVVYLNENAWLSPSLKSRYNGKLDPALNFSISKQPSPLWS